MKLDPTQLKDWQIAEAAESSMKPLSGLADDLGLVGDELIPMGRRLAKVDYAGQKDASLHRAERQSGSFRRAFALPAEVDADKVEAVHKNGVLVLRLPKKPEHQPRQISVLAS